MKSVLKEILEWVIECSSPNNHHKYSRCIVCDSTWWDDKERHEFKCWVPKLKELQKEPTPQKYFDRSYRTKVGEGGC